MIKEKKLHRRFHIHSHVASLFCLLVTDLLTFFLAKYKIKEDKEVVEKSHLTSSL